MKKSTLKALILEVIEQKDRLTTQRWQRHNVGTIVDYFLGDGRFSESKNNEIEHDLESLAVLKKIKIKKHIGSGAFKAAFLLDNDHVWSIGELANKGEGNELNTYKKLQDKQFSGEASSSDLAVYDFGWASEANKIFYVETGKVIPFIDWLSYTKRVFGWVAPETREEEEILINMAHKITKLKADEGKTVEEIDTIINLDEIESKLTIVTRGELEAIYKMIKNAVFNYHEQTVEDLHFGNYGINIQNPSEMVLFDV